ncbi:MAG: cellulosome anchor protein [Firmicutes bacterium]|nr:cellulosome anchor protein [Bacillota bacterium]
MVGVFAARAGKIRILFLGLVVSVAIFLCQYVAVSAICSAAPNLALANDYIKIFVNTDEDAMGRFAVDTTGGDPENPKDDNKPLVYGRPKPWTSYTSVKIDGRTYCFGGPTEKRAGAGADYGECLKPPHIGSGNTIAATWGFGDIEVTQQLRPVRSITSGLFDTAEIRYIVANNGTSTHDVGLRIVLDTMLGANDGAPMRVGEAAVTTDTMYEGNGVPDFWQAFDSLSNPEVTSQGTLRGGGATPPDRVFLTNWGSLADGVWDFDFQPGRDFTRKGEYELDSAAALFWDPRPLGPGEEREYITLYGLGAISIARGTLSIGVTSPAEVVKGRGRSAAFPVICYIENTGDAEAYKVNVSIQLPEGLNLVSGQSRDRQLGNLPAGATTQVVWNVEPQAQPGTVLTYMVRVTAENVEDNQVKRTVRILAPARLSAKLSGPGALGIRDERYHPSPFKVTGTIKNVGDAPAYGLKATILPGQGLATALREKPSKLLGSLEPGETCDVAWQLVPAGGKGNFKYDMKVESPSAEPSTSSGKVKVPELEPKVRVILESSAIKAGEFFAVDVMATNIGGFKSSDISISYDPRVLEAVSVSRGTVFVEDGRLLKWDEGVIDNSKGVIKGIRGEVDSPLTAWGTLCTINFRAKAPGVSRIELPGLELKNSRGGKIALTIADGKVSVK